MIAHVVSAVVSTPVPTPEIIKETIVKPIAQTPADVLQLATLVTVFGAGAVVSLFHLIGKLKINWLDGNVNRIVTLVIGLGIGLVSTFTQGDFHLDVPGVVVAVVSVAMSLLGQGTTFNVYKFLQELGTTSAGVDSAVTQELATETIPAPTATI